MNWESIKTAILNTGIKVVIALVILIVAFKIINIIFKKLKAGLDKAGKLDSMLIKALINAGRWLAKILVVIALVGYLGIDTTGFSALIASLGVALGLAVNGTLSNFAGGVLLLVTRPFKIGDYIAVAGFEGTVDDLKVVSTKLITLDNKVVYVPNGVVSTSAVTNFTALDIRRVDLNFNVAAGTDFNVARDALVKMCLDNPKVVREPAPVALLNGPSKRGIEIICRSYCKPEDYWDVYFGLIEAVGPVFAAKGITTPNEQLIYYRFSLYERRAIDESQYSDRSRRSRHRYRCDRQVRGGRGCRVLRCCRHGHHQRDGRHHLAAQEGEPLAGNHRERCGRQTLP